LAVADTDTTTAIVATTVDAMVITGAMVAGVIGNHLR
jgi:hypothetical protein